MARHRRTGTAEDIIELTALLPWWAAVTLASIRHYMLPLLCLIGVAADGEKILVQCKLWKAYNAGESMVRKLFGLMIAIGAVSAEAIVKHTAEHWNNAGQVFWNYFEFQPKIKNLSEMQFQKNNAPSIKMTRRA